MVILIVDDDPKLGTLLSLRLKAAGYQTVAVHTAEKALAYLGRDRPVPEVNLVILDIFLPEASGIELCRKLKEDPKTCDIPVIVLTSSDDEEHLQQAFDAGAVDYIEKPFKGVELVARIGSALRLKAEIDQRKRQAKELLAIAEQLKRANEQLRQLSFHDSLTGLHNRRYFDEFLKREFKRAQRLGAELALIMIDIDYFKAYNDRFGHQAGDEALRQVAAALTSVVQRSNDLAARYGGEEFAIVLPDTSQPASFVIAKTLCQRVEALRLPHPDSPFGMVTISAGIAVKCPKPKEQMHQLIKAADTALYHSKRAGRNQVSVASFV